MPEDPGQMQQRKLEHIHIVTKEQVEPHPSSFDGYRIPYRALPELDLNEIDTSCHFLGKRLSFPFLVSSMTGGPERAAVINKNLAEACEQVGAALGLGSMRVLLRDPGAASSFKVRHLCPSVPLLANLGLVQLNYGVGADEVNLLIDTVEADGIFLHVNPLQEAVQPEGDTDFSGLLGKLERLIPKIPVPVIVKEVGSGIDPVTAQRLADIGVEWVDVAGAGGTSWTRVEGYRRQDRLGQVMKEICISSDQALIGARDIPGLRLIGSGGVRTGLDVAKAIALGADLVGTAKPFLEPAIDGVEPCLALLRLFKKELAVAMFAAGAPNLSALKKIALQKV